MELHDLSSLQAHLNLTNLLLDKTLVALSLVDMLGGEERYALHPLTRAFVRDELLADVNIAHETEVRFTKYWGSTYTIIHVSDLHFGPSYVPYLGELTLHEILSLNPDVVVISGDLSLHARDNEFIAARDWINRIPVPTLVIPGNSDQSLFNPFERFAAPLARYRKHMRREVDETLSTNGFFVVGVNDSRPILPGGFWSRTQREWIQRQFESAPMGSPRVLATHHQLLWESYRPSGFWYPSHALQFLSACGVELVLNGHTHIPSASQTLEGIVVVRAGTATTSLTKRNSRNSYNLISVNSKTIQVQIREFDASADMFVEANAFEFARRSTAVLRDIFTDVRG